MRSEAKTASSDKLPLGEREEEIATPKLCECCRKPLRLKLKGRKRRFCSNRCRSAARRNRDFVSSGYPNSATTQNDERNAAKAVISGAENRDQASPVNVVGNGYRWPRRLDPKLVAKIVEREIGGRLIRAGTGAEPVANDNLPSSKMRAA